MKKKLLFLFSLCVLAAGTAFSQEKRNLGTPATNPNYEHDRFTYMYIDSRDEPVSAQHMQILVFRANTIHTTQAKMERYRFVFQILENKKLSLDDRRWAADFMYKRALIDNSYPIEYIQTMQTTLATQTN